MCIRDRLDAALDPAPDQGDTHRQLFSDALAKAISEIEIACLAGDIPEAIEIDITNLMLNEAIRLSEITLPEGAEIPGFDEENDQMIVSVNPPRAEEEEPEILAEVEEGDVVEVEEASEDQDGGILDVPAKIHVSNIMK